MLGISTIRNASVIALVALSTTSCAMGAEDVDADDEIDSAEEALEAPLPKYPGKAKWKLVFRDEFNGTSLDTKKWSKPREKDGRYDPDFVSVANGKLRLKIDRDGNAGVKGARVDTLSDARTGAPKYAQKYGFYETRAKVPPTDKTLFAFWLQSQNVDHVDGTGHDGCEIDVVETMARGDNIVSTLHWDGYKKDHKQASSGDKPAPGLHSGFHTFGLEWEEHWLKVYYDGVLKWTYKDTDGPAVPRVAEYLILSSERGFGHGDLSKAKLPYYAEVDYVRAWTRD